jgi:mRNA-degrading endonuclease YafQ of YafQ-DinJ toxin-antitoxin module
MKYIITSTLLLLTISLFSQAQDENFYLSESKISWSKAYKTDKTKEQVFAYFEKSDLFSVFKIVNDQVFAVLNPHATNPKITGVAGVPKIVNDNDFIGDVSIVYRSKEKEYVITFEKLKFVGRGNYFKKKEEQSFEDHFLQKDISEYRLYFLKKPKTVYNQTFEKIFIMK